jgi:choline dehydrogenase-like flavoprotein
VDEPPLLVGFGSEHSEALRRLVANACAARAGDVWRAARRALSLDGLHWEVPNVSLHDGSIFATGIGANPQLSIYGIVNPLATGLAKLLSARDVQSG